MEWKDVGSTIGKFAPSLATALGGPLAGSAIQALEDVFGLSGDGSTDQRKDELVARLQGATQADLLAIKVADQSYTLKMAELGYKDVADLEGIAAGDRDSARKREMSVQDWTPRILAYVLITGFLGMAVGVLFGTLKADTVLAGTVIGYMSAKAEQVVAYYFGSSAGSQKKTDLLSKADAIKE